MPDLSDTAANGRAQETNQILVDDERSEQIRVLTSRTSAVHALRNLWGTLKDSDAVPEAIDYVAAAYTRRTGQALGEPTD